jgi:hypothetical protein
MNGFMCCWCGCKPLEPPREENLPWRYPPWYLHGGYGCVARKPGGTAPATGGMAVWYGCRVRVEGGGR